MPTSGLYGRDSSYPYSTKFRHFSELTSKSRSQTHVHIPGRVAEKAACGAVGQGSSLLACNLRVYSTRGPLGRGVNTEQEGIISQALVFGMARTPPTAPDWEDGAGG